MSETKPIYDSGAAPAPAATCPTCGHPVKHVGWIGIATPIFQPIHADPLTALERRVVEEAVAYIDCPGMKLDLKRLQIAVGLLQNAQYIAARAATEAGT